MGVQVRKLRLAVQLLLRPQGLHPFGHQLGLRVVHIRWVVVDFEASMSRPACQDEVYASMSGAVCQYE